MLRIKFVWFLPLNGRVPAGGFDLAGHHGTNLRGETMNVDKQAVIKNGLFSIKSEEPFFSWNECEFCDGIAGNRYTIDFKYRHTDRDILEADICEDCLQEIAS